MASGDSDPMLRTLKALDVPATDEVLLGGGLEIIE